MLHCPFCHQGLTPLNPSGKTLATCFSCYKEVGLLTGTLESHRAHLLTQKGNTRQLRDLYHQRHYLRLVLDGGLRHQVDFEFSGLPEEIRLTQGDQLSLYFTHKNDRTPHYLSLTNQATSKIYIPISSEIVRRWSLDPSFATVVLYTCVSAILSLVFEFKFHVAMALSLLPSVPTYWLISSILKRQATPVELTPIPEPPEVHSLKAQFQALKVKKLQLNRCLTAQETQLDYLKDFLGKMKGTGAFIYTERMHLVQKAITTLEDLHQTDLDLMTHYDKALALLVLEMKSSNFSHRLKSEGLYSFQARLDEIEATERRHAELRRQAHANTEVAALLKQAS